MALTDLSYHNKSRALPLGDTSINNPVFNYIPNTGKWMWFQGWDLHPYLTFTVLWL